MLIFAWRPGWELAPWYVWVLSLGTFALALGCWLWMFWQLLRRRWPSRKTAKSQATEEPKDAQHLRFDHDRPPEIVIDNSDPPAPLRRGHYDFDWNG